MGVSRTAVTQDEGLHCSDSPCSYCFCGPPDLQSPWSGWAWCCRPRSSGPHCCSCCCPSGPCRPCCTRCPCGPPRPCGCPRCCPPCCPRCCRGVPRRGLPLHLQLRC